MFKLSHLLLNPKRAVRHPFEILFLGLIYSSISILISLWIFPDYASLVMVFLTVLSCIYVVQGTMLVEEKKEKAFNSEEWRLKQHFKTLTFLMFLFIGFTLSFTLWTLILPSETVDSLFAMQRTSTQSIPPITGNAVSENSFWIILENNLKVLFFSLIFAVFYGAGSIFILAWNASVMGFVIGSLAKYTLGASSLPLLFTKYFIHGLPEMLAYFVAALAGGIVFISLIKADLEKETLKRIAKDVIVLIAISVMLLIIAALLEVYISPFV